MTNETQNAREAQIINLKGLDGTDKEQAFAMLDTVVLNGATYMVLIPNIGDLPDGITEIKADILIAKIVDDQSVDIVSDPKELDAVIEEASKTIPGIQKEEVK